MTKTRFGGRFGWRSALVGIGSAILAMFITGTATAGLQEFRQPNALEKAYFGIAADLRLPELCAKISGDALNRVRKPTLVRSQCYYYVALNTRDTSHCTSVEPIPVGVGVMNWLTPERCELQVIRLQASDKPYLPSFDFRVVIDAMGYTATELDPWLNTDGRADWKSVSKAFASSEGTDRHRDFLRRLAALPDFNKVSRAEDQVLFYTKQQEDREFYWVLNHGMRLCLAGHGGPNCNEETYRLFRKGEADYKRYLARPRNAAEEAVKATVREEAAAPSESSGLREPSTADSAYYDLAVKTREADFCGKIGQDVAAVGWSVDPGLVFMPLRSVCLSALAVGSLDSALCRDVRSFDRPDIDGDGLSPAFCQRMVSGKETAVHKLTMRPQWRSILERIGYRESDIPPKISEGRESDLSWLLFADALMDPQNPDHEAFLDRMRDVPDQGETMSPDDGGRTLSVVDVQKLLYQFTVVRFHCSLNQSAGKYAFQGYTLKAPTDFSGAFKLIDHHGDPVTDRDFRGKYLMVYFGYTYCPDVCPTSLWTIAEALNKIGPLADQIQPVFISVDPERDTPEQLASYVELYHPSLIGLTGTAEAIRKAAKAYQAYYFVGQVDGEYVVDHTSWTYLLGPDGKAITHFDHGIEVDDLAGRLTDILRGKS